MCGINGIMVYGPSGRPVSEAELLAIRDSMFNRGPDGSGLWVSGNRKVGLAHRRLAIIDLSDKAAQPMTDPDRQFHIVFNGEIYNYRSLRESLLGEGVTFRTHSDTEVLLQLYRKKGPAMVSCLRGMFAFAIWDVERQELFLARDRYGIKPLYYHDDGNSVRFCSQVNALLSGGAVHRRIEPAGVAGFLLWGSVPEPYTICRGIAALPAGCTLKITRHGLGQVHRYWDISTAIEKSCEKASLVAAGDEEEYVISAMRDSVAQHMVADVPVGAFLSAGYDSSAVVALAREFSKHSLQTFTLAFEDFQGGTLDEAPLASLTANHLGVTNLQSEISAAGFEEEFSKFISCMDQPTVDGVNTWLVSKLAHEAGLKVCLSGLGGDELLGGYPSFSVVPRLVRQMHYISRLPVFGYLFRVFHSRLIAPFQRPPFRFLGTKAASLIEMGGEYASAYQLYRGVFLPWELDRIIDDEVVREGVAALKDLEIQDQALIDGNLNSFGKVAALEGTHYMRNQLLRDTDWIGMAHSLEIRVPLVDHMLTERLIGLAALGRLGDGKSIITGAFRNILPDELAARPKTGFTVPTWRWLRHSPQLAAWRSNTVLRRRNTSTEKLLAYSILASYPDGRDIIKH